MASRVNFMRKSKLLEAHRFFEVSKVSADEDTKEINVAEILAALRIPMETNEASTNAEAASALPPPETAPNQKIKFKDRLRTREGKTALGISAAIVLAVAIGLSHEAYESTHPTVALVSNPKGAEVWLNGKILGHSPIRKSLAPGKYRVQFKLAGYESRSEFLVLDKDGHLKTGPDAF
jgi:hypothetical protein